MTPTPMYIKVAFTMVDDMRPARDRFTTVDAAKERRKNQIQHGPWFSGLVG